MTYRGRVKNGVIVLEDDARLPEDTPVRIELTTEPGVVEASSPSVFEVNAWSGPTGIRDLAINHDHYLYGHPKVTRE